MKKRPVIVIGAGAAGLAAAEKLSDEFEVTVLEALDRVGGRIRTIKDAQATTVIEAGSEFIHGRLPITFDLVEKAGATIETVEGKMYRVTDCDWAEQTEMIEGWEQLLEKMDTSPEDITLDAFLESCYSTSEYESLRRHAREYAAGFDLADPTKASIKSLYAEWTAESDEQYRIKGGYQTIIDHLKEQCLQKDCKILTNKKVTRVNWRRNHVSVQTADGDIYSAAKVIITLPAGIMKKTAAKAAISISPALDHYIEAYRKIGYGSVMKIILRFYEPFWKEKKELGFIFSEEIIPTWWTQLPDNSPVLTGWLGGPAAVQWSGIDDETILGHALNSLSNIFNIKSAELKDRLLEHHIFNWHTIETACGAYSYETPLSSAAREILTQPVENTIYFAGEALYNGPYPGTVEAALNSGMSVAEKINSENVFQDTRREMIDVS